MLWKKNTAVPVFTDMNTRQKRFETLARALHADVYRYAYWLCGHAQTAEDLVQESFLRAWKALDSLRDEKAAKAWLVTIVRRENARLYERYTPEFVDIDAQHELSGDDACKDSFMLRRAIATLPGEYREALTLQIIGGFTGAEIARILDLNEKTVSTRLFRARKRLQELFNKDKANTKQVI